MGRKINSYKDIFVQQKNKCLEVTKRERGEINEIRCKHKVWKAYSATSDQETFRKENWGHCKTDRLGLTGFEAKITGGSDKDGFPMYPTLSGAGRKIFTANSLGFKATRKGEKRVSVEETQSEQKQHK